jgi:cell division protein FtsN
MPRQSSSAHDRPLRRRRSGSWLEKKIGRIRDSRSKQKQLQQMLVIIAAVLIAFILGYYFFGPSFSSGE